MELITLALGFGIGFILGFFTALYLVLRSSLFSGLISQQIDEIVENLPTIIDAHPDIVENLVKRLTGAAMKQFGVEKTGGSRKLNIGGFKIDMEAVQMAMQLFGGTAKQGIEKVAERLVPG